jgi:hypothetical protein
VIRRRLFAAASAISLLLCLAVVVLWVRSFWVMSELSHWQDGVQSDSGLGGGAFWVDRFTEVSNSWRTPGWSFHNAPFQSGILSGISTVAGFSYEHDKYGNLMLTVPLWFAAACCAPFPAIWAASRLKWRRHAANTCMHCRYDLTGNTSGVCPECGTPVGGKMGVKG